MRRILFSILFFIILGSTIKHPAFASPCTPIYGGGDTCPTNQFSIEKTVMNPATNKFVTNLGITDQAYTIHDTVNFQVTITNNTNQKLTTITVKDILPDSLDFVSGQGTWDTKNKILSTTIPTLDANKAIVFTITTKVLINPPSEPLCDNNKATATMNDKTMFATTQFCIQHSAFQTQTNTPIYPTSKNTSKTPKTGAEELCLLAFLPLSGVGIYLKRIKLT